jgi:hyaluronoglucosaminidase
LSHLSTVYKNSNVAWGIGLSPYEIYLTYDAEAKQALDRKVDAINTLDPDILCVLLDDMKGDVPGLAETQAEIFNQIADRSTARRLVLCPTYYSFDPILEKVFGAMPEDYWDVLGREIDPAVDIFWTGPNVCSTEYPEAHLEEVSERLGRKPFIWDNYPVNDSEKRSKRLYLGPYENRPHQLSELSAGHAVNPMNQACLSQIPFWTLGESYRTKSDYNPKAALTKAVEALCDDPGLVDAILGDASTFEEQGLGGISESHRQKLIEKYNGFRSVFADEIVDWLSGGYTFDPACLTE